MYTIDKLQKLNDYLDSDSNESILARYLLTNLQELNTISLQKCIRETNISKSSIHRFFNSGGFDSFKDLVSTLIKEAKNDIEEDIVQVEDSINFINTDNQIEYFCKLLENSKNIYFYGNQNQLDKLQFIKKYLRARGKMYYSLNIWNVQKSLEKLLSLDNNDLLVVLDTSLRIQDLYEISMNYRNLINLDEIINYNFQKIFIGESNCGSFRGFYNIKFTEKNFIGLNKFDCYIYEKLMKRGI